MKFALTLSCLQREMCSKKRGGEWRMAGYRICAMKAICCPSAEISEESSEVTPTSLLFFLSFYDYKKCFPSSQLTVTPTHHHINSSQLKEKKKKQYFSIHITSKFSYNQIYKGSVFLLLFCVKMYWSNLSSQTPRRCVEVPSSGEIL